MSDGTVVFDGSDVEALRADIVDNATTEGAVYTAVGAASACWETLEGAGVFQDGRAKAIGDLLLEVVHQPRLGFATTEELLRELAARFHVQHGDLSLSSDMESLIARLDDEQLAYRTVDSDE